MLRIRREEPRDHRLVEELTRAAFFNLFVPGCAEHLLIHKLRTADCFIPELDMVVADEGRVIGHIAYTRAALKRPGKDDMAVITFGPVSVQPDRQGQGVGSLLIRHTLDLAATLGHQAVIILGDPAFYARFGFMPAEQYGIGTARRMYLDSLLALELVPGSLTGKEGSTFHEDPAFDMSEDEIKRFDAGFPAREKGSSPTQARFQQLVNSRKPMPPLV